MPEPQHGGWAERPEGAEEIPLVGPFGMSHMPVDPPAPRPRPPIPKGLPPAPAQGEPGDERGEWVPV